MTSAASTINLFTPPWIYATIASVLFLLAMFGFLSKCIFDLIDRRGLNKVPENTKALTPEDYEALCCRTGFTRKEISRLYSTFMTVSEGKLYEDAEKVIKELPYFAGPLQDRMVSALKLPPRVDFVILATVMSVFSERTSLEDKMRFLFNLYSADNRNGVVDKKDLTELLDVVLPEFQDEDERTRLIDRAVQGTMEELCGNTAEPELGMEQFNQAATPLIGERCTIFF
eukprot:TRINITY_DN66728_c0_g1_i1.p1 TRINITY_DN66728_c0_g1~~TRINITY_DN66728_c0_g1_i1.p1  ORF type:complete len:228 (-),score=41.00 TRINITY_DN66728_c0_g1_i1:135-818(-)